MILCNFNSFLIEHRTPEKYVSWLKKTTMKNLSLVELRASTTVGKKKGEDKADCLEEKRRVAYGANLCWRTLNFRACATVRQHRLALCILAKNVSGRASKSQPKMSAGGFQICSPKCRLEGFKFPAQNVGWRVSNFQPKMSALGFQNLSQKCQL